MLERALFLLGVLASSAAAQDTTVTLWTRETLRTKHPVLAESKKKLKALEESRAKAK